jgi:hypothetical protein
LLPMQSALTWLSAAALTLVFAWAALAKMLRYGDWRRALAAYGFTRSGATIAAPGVPVVEAGTAMVLALVSARLGAALSLVLLSGFSFAVLRARARRGNRLPCGCFGRTKARDYRLMLVRNALLVVLTAVVLISDETEGLLSGMEVPSAGQVVPVLLAAVGVLVLATVLWQANRSLTSTRAASTNEERSAAALIRREKST